MGLGASLWRSATTSMSKASARWASAVPIPPRPSMASFAPCSVPNPGEGMFQCFGGSVTNEPGMRFTNESMQAMTHSAMGMALRPRELVSTH